MIVSPSSVIESVAVGGVVEEFLWLRGRRLAGCEEPAADNEQHDPRQELRHVPAVPSGTEPLPPSHMYDCIIGQPSQPRAPSGQPERARRKAGYRTGHRRTQRRLWGAS